MQMAYDCGLIINTVHFLYTMILASISIDDKGDDAMSKNSWRTGFIFGGKNEKLSKSLGEQKPLKFCFKMTLCKDIQTLLPLFHDNGLIDDD